MYRHRGEGVTDSGPGEPRVLHGQVLHGQVPLSSLGLPPPGELATDYGVKSSFSSFLLVSLPQYPSCGYNPHNFISRSFSCIFFISSHV